jgi:soluble lytic murein transglycosylase-like protein
VSRFGQIYLREVAELGRVLGARLMRGAGTRVGRFVHRGEMAAGHPGSFLDGFASAGCGRMAAVGAGLALALLARGPSWRDVPLDVELAGEVQTDPRADERGAIEAILASRSTLRPEARVRVARAIVEESADADLDPVFILAVIGVESELDDAAVSPVGAKGLMQVRNATAMYLGEQEQMGLGPQTVDDPALNVRVGIRYLHRLQKAFGDLSLALVAYNAGPHRVSEYLHDGVPLPDRLTAYPRKVRSQYRKLLSQLADGSLRVEHPLTIRVAER